jgi:hypothetical protein
VTTKRFETVVVMSNPDGTPSALAVDLRTNGAKRLLAIKRLTDNFLFDAKPLLVPWGEEGAWITVPLGKDDIAMCQWKPGPKLAWEFGLPVGRLKFVRIIRRADESTYLEIIKEIQNGK